MKILLRTYRTDMLCVLDTLTGKEERLGKDEGVYILKDGALIKPDELPMQRHYMFQSCVNGDLIALYGISPVILLGNYTKSCYDVYCIHKAETPELVTAALQMDTGGSQSDTFLDEAVPSEENGKIKITCSMRKHRHVGHKTEEEWHAEWTWDGVWHKVPWGYAETRRGW